jgi:hypothetical protein
MVMFVYQRVIEFNCCNGWNYCALFNFSRPRSLQQILSLFSVETTLSETTIFLGQSYIDTN